MLHMQQLITAKYTQEFIILSISLYSLTCLFISILVIPNEILGMELMVVVKLSKAHLVLGVGCQGLLFSFCSLFSAVQKGINQSIVHREKGKLTDDNRVTYDVPIKLTIYSIIMLKAYIYSSIKITNQIRQFFYYNKDLNFNWLLNII